VVEVAKAMLVKRSVKAIANNSPWFLVIVTELYKFNKCCYKIRHRLSCLSTGLKYGV
jgi:hypothetical protein